MLHDSPEAPRKLDPKIPRDLETIVLKAIAKEPGDRYADGAGAGRGPRTVPGGPADPGAAEHAGRAVLAVVPAQSLAGRGQHHRGGPDDGPRHRFDHRGLDVPRPARHDQQRLVQASQSEAQERRARIEAREQLFESLAGPGPRQAVQPASRDSGSTAWRPWPRRRRSPAS